MATGSDTLMKKHGKGQLCDTIDNYNSSAYYEPSYVITRAYSNGGF